jgi:AcrR family transcriptional regulator
MSMIAREAGVALKTVYLAFETKSGLLRAVWNLLLRGDEDAATVTERRWYREVLEEPDPRRQLRLNARNSAAGKRRIAAIAEVIRSAAPLDAEIDALWRRIGSEYHANQGAIIESLNEKGALAPRLDVGAATDILWTLNHPNTWHLLVDDRGWTPQRYEQWCGDTACAQLLRSPSSRAKRE